MTLDELLKAATPRPWTATNEEADEYWFAHGYMEIRPAGIPIGGAFDQYGAPVAEGQANAALICHAVNHFPALVAALEAVWAELDNRYDVDTLSDGAGGGTHRESPFPGAGALMEQARLALALARNVEASK